MFDCRILKVSFHVSSVMKLLGMFIIVKSSFQVSLLLRYISTMLKILFCYLGTGLLRVLVKE